MRLRHRPTPNPARFRRIFSPVRRSRRRMVPGPSATRNTFCIRFSVSPMYLSKMAAVSNFTSGSFHSPAMARAHMLLPQPCTPRMMAPRGGSRPKSRAASSQVPRRWASQRLRLSRPPTLRQIFRCVNELQHSGMPQLFLFRLQHIGDSFSGDAVPGHDRL